ncbi:MAG TPA: P-loop NTPase fold protein [Methanocorpusculum sp.]|nr:P-loop NTPase fold protein [Methanocorpusculum sp.]
MDTKKKAFCDLVNKFASEDKPLLIFVDELDGCRPTFAIEMLEAVKHFFDLENVIFVFSMDIGQLSCSIRTIYGEIDCVGYLQRFFDYQIRLPSPNLREYLRERLIHNDRELLEEVEHLSILVERLTLSLRDINVICEAYLRFINQKYEISNSILGMRRFGKIYLSLIALKYSDPVRYIDIIQNGIEITDQNDRLIIDLFGMQESTIKEWKSFYTKEIAQSSVKNIISSSSLSDSFQAAKNYLLFDPEIN